MKTRYADVVPYVTRDGSLIRELMHPRAQGTAAPSLAAAEVAPGGATLLHLHRVTEELYHVTAGEGVMVLGDMRLAIGAGDTVCIPPGTPHCVENTGRGALKILCCCSPAYSHEDTVLL